MRYVLTLIAAPLTSPERPIALDETFLAKIRTELAKVNCKDIACDWLSPGEALDVEFSFSGDSADLQPVRAKLGCYPLDFAIQNVTDRRKKLLVADMESTIIREEMLDEIAAEAGLGDEIAGITRRAMAGELNFEDALRHRVRLLRNLPEQLLVDLRQDMTFTPGAEALVRTMKAAGAHTALISGGFTIFARSVAERCGFESYRANRLEIAKGRLSGKLKDPVLGPAAKKEALRELAHAHAFRLDQTLAVGDGANDIEMICAAGLGVGYRPKEVLKQKAPVSIFHGDLTALLFLQGYRRNEFASS